MLAAATVHFPYMTAWPDKASAEHQQATLDGFRQLGKAFVSSRIDTLVVLSSEHIVNLQPRMAPPFVIGTGANHRAFPEPQFNLVPVTRPGDPELANGLVQALYAEGFDPAHASELKLDHGTSLPLQQLALPAHVRIVPIIINTLFPPLPSLSRCRALGAALGKVLAQQTTGRRVALLATGGISHSVGEPGVDQNHPDFDSAFIQELVSGNLDEACRYSDSQLDALGNGTHEIRSWVAVAAAVHPARPKVVTSIPYAPGWLTGVHQLLWESP